MLVLMYFWKAAHVTFCQRDLQFFTYLWRDNTERELAGGTSVTSENRNA